MEMTKSILSSDIPCITCCYSVLVQISTSENDFIFCSKIPGVDPYMRYIEHCGARQHGK